VLGDVRRAHLQGRLYFAPPLEDVARNQALASLASAGLVEPVPATAASLGGWSIVGERCWVAESEILAARALPRATRGSVLGAIRRASLFDRLYPDPPREDIARNAALDELAGDGLIEPILATATSVGGWHVVE
jgi:hypothetical protein